MFLADNIGFAIPSNRVDEVVAAIRKHNSVPRSWTGLHLQPLRDFERSIFIPARDGVIVASALIRLIQEHLPDNGYKDEVLAYTKSLKAATLNTRTGFPASTTAGK